MIPTPLVMNLTTRITDHGTGDQAFRSSLGEKTAVVLCCDSGGVGVKLLRARQCSSTFCYFAYLYADYLRDEKHNGKEKRVLIMYIYI